jgi:diaminopimelate epimerase
MFPNRINVQFAKPVSQLEAEILIWERGAGYTLASGSSSSAVAAVLFKHGLCNSNVTISMPGGKLELEVKNDWNLRLRGEAKQIAEGVLSSELVELLTNQ